MTTPHVPRPRGQRLSSINRPESIRAMTPSRRRGGAAAASSNCCEAPDIQDSPEGQKVCYNCGKLIAEQNIVSEVTFAETGAGGAMVLGQSVGENQRHARASGPGFRRTGGGSESRSFARELGTFEINALCNTLNLRSEAIREQAMKIYSLALDQGFIQGRRSRTVAAVCIYLVCRMNKDYTILLMDVAEKIQVNVFALGDTYKELKDQLYIAEPAHVASVSPVIDIEALVMRFANKLEFGDKTIQVASDAVAILRRMKRDWMVEGRQPAGLCGACLLMAARANNFRRTAREVVFVVRIGDATVGRRMHEFRKTPASQLSIQAFRDSGDSAQDMAKPPSLYKAEAREKRKREKLLRLQQAAEMHGSEEPEELRRDDDGFLIPAIPIDPALTSDAADLEEVQAESSVPAKRKRGRPPKEKTPLVPTPSPQQLAEERALEREIETIIHDPENIDSAHAALSDEAHLKAEANAKALAEQLRGTSQVNDEEEIREDEFDDDPEIANCLLSPAEIEIKERIWVTHNEDWLRAQQAKMMKKVLEEASGGPKKTTRRRKRKTGPEGEEEPPPRDAAEGIMRNLQGKSVSKSFSKHINYEALTQVYGTSGSNSRATSLAPSEGAASTRPGSAGRSERQRTSVSQSPAPVPALPTPAATQASQQASRVQEKLPVADADDYEVVEEMEDEGTAPQAKAGAEQEDEDEDEEEEYDEDEQDYEEAIDPMNVGGDWEGDEEYD